MIWHIGGHMNVGMGKEVVSGRMANLWNGQAIQTRLLNSASDGYPPQINCCYVNNVQLHPSDYSFLSKYDLAYDNWATFKDTV
jgi:hypothetical protein